MNINQKNTYKNTYKNKGFSVVSQVGEEFW